MPSMSETPKFERTAFEGPSEVGSGSTPSPGSSPFAAASSSRSLFTSSSTDTPIGSIITAVAVFETHMETKPVATMKPRTSRDGLVPIMPTIARAMRLWRFQRCIARARMKPPMNRKMMLLP